MTLPTIYSTYGITPVAKYSVVARRLHFAFVTTQGMIGVLNSMLAGVFGGLLAHLVTGSIAVSLVVGAIALAGAFAAQMAYGVSIYERSRSAMSFRFPSPSLDQVPATDASEASPRA